VNDRLVATDEPNASWLLPIGTAVVALVDLHGADGRVQRARGAVGLVSRAPADHTHSYRIRFADGVESSLLRRELAVLKHYQRGDLTGHDPFGALGLFEHVVFRCIVGSRAYGLEGDDSDTDRRGIYLPPADMHWSLYGVPEQLENDERQECFWELQKFLSLALKANPNILECLYTPLVEFTTPLIDDLLAMRQCFLSKLVYQTYNGYVMSQFRKMQRDIRIKGAVKNKHAMHLIRLLLAGIHTLRESTVPVHVSEHRDELLAVRNGSMSFDQVDAWRLRLHAEFDQAFAATSLPERPDYERVNTFLIRARQSMVNRGGK